MKKIKLISIITFISLLSIGCSEETSVPDAEFKVEIIESFTHGENLYVANYDSADNNFILGYWNNADEPKGVFEVRDINFNTIKTDIFEGNNFPISILKINESIFIGTHVFEYYKTKENFVIRKYTDPNGSSSIAVYDSEIINRDANFGYNFSDRLNGFLDTEKYIVIPAERATCYFIRKTDFEAISFQDYFGENRYIGSGGHAVGIDELDRIILSTNRKVLVYENNEWLPFLNGELDGIDYRQFYTDSRNRLYASGGGEIIVYDMNTKKKLIDIKGSSLNGLVKDLSKGKILGEHPDGSIILFISHGYSESNNRIFKINITQN